ncbi:MAG: hypothetical protein ABIO72_00175 [Patescibacteria group bacterium]
MKPSISMYFVFATVMSLILGTILGYALAAYEFNRPVQSGGTSQTAISFEECVAMGNPVMESYPRQCRTTDGKLFVEDIKAVPPTPPSNTPPPATDPEQPQAKAKDGCIVGGCSSQICALDTGEPIISTCEFRSEYSCYKFSTCEKQKDGQCGWTQTTELKSCLKNPPPLI